LDAAGDVPIRALSAGTINVCAAGQDGTAYCWGSVGIDDGPEKVAGPPNVTAIVSDVGTYCAIGGGDLYCWGSYEHGELGNGMVGKIGDSEPTPQKVEGLSNVTSVAIESGTVCAVASAAIYCWGDNPVGQLGNGTTEPSARPVRVEGLGAATSVTMGFGTVCAVAADEAWCWGNNRYGQLGDGTTERQFTPRRVGGLGRVTAVATSSTVSCGISDETLYCWGNASGLLGTPEPSGSHSTPVPVPGFGKVSGLALGGNVTQGADNTLKSSHSVLCAVTDGRPVCAGANDAGQLGSGNTEPQTAPVTVPGLSSVTQVVAGASFACALSDGHTYCWGDGFDDAHGKGPGLTPTQVHWPT
jgi:serine/threonine-protein kinase